VSRTEPGSAKGNPDGEDIASAILSALNHRDRRVRGRVIEEAARAADPDRLVKAVADQVDAVRRNAAMDALVRGGARSVPALVRALDDPDPEVVMFAASLLGKTRTREAMPYLVRLLDYEDVNIVQAAVESLGHLRATVAVMPLVSLLERDPWVRYAAIHALGEIGDARAAEPLGTALGDRDGWDLTIAALGKIRSLRAIEHLATALYESVTSSEFEAPLRALGDALRRQPAAEPLWGIPAWTRLARERTAELRVQLAELLERGSRDAPEDLELAEAAATLIRLLRIEPLYGSLVRAGRRPVLRPAIQFHAIGIGAAVVPAVAEGLLDPQPAVREFACSCAGALRDDDLAEPLIACLADSHAVVRETAVRALGQLRPIEAVAPLAERLMDPEPAVQAAAQEALGAFDPTAASHALLAYPRREPAVMIAMLRVMRSSPHPDQLPFLVDCLRGDDPEIRRLAVEAIAEQPDLDVVDLLEPALDDPDDEVRRAAVKMIGRRRTARSSEVLLELLARSPSLARLLVETLVEMDGLAIVPRLLAIYIAHPTEPYLPILVELAHLREPAAEPLVVGLLGDPEPEIRRIAIRAMALFGSTVATRHIIASATDPAWQVRATVAEVLGELGHPDARVELERLCLDEHAFVATAARHRLELDEGI